MGAGTILPASSHLAETAPRYPTVDVERYLSAKQFQQETLVEQTAAILKRTEFDPKNLELEITESIAMQDVKSTVDVLRRLKGLGLHLGIDDFGTGYSALSYLSNILWTI